MKETIYLLTGAAGFLGINVSQSLIARGKKVRALVLEGDPAAKRIPPEAEIIGGNLLDPASLDEFFDVSSGAEVIVLHIASFVTVNPEWNQKVYDVNVTGTKNIIKKCLEYKVKKLVYISSTGAIPEIPKGQVIKEINSFDINAVVGCYSKTKAEATQLVLDAVRDTRLDASIVYPSGICGPGDFAYTFFARFIIDCANGAMPAGIAGSFNSVDVRDLADGVIACAEKGRKGEGYIMSNSFVTIQDIFSLIHRFTGAPEVKVVLPVPAAKFLAFFAEIAAKITKKPAMLTTFSIYNLARNNNFDCSRAVQELGFKCRPFEKTIEDTIDWLQAEGKIQIGDGFPVPVVKKAA
ncbi:epimerase [Spirochaetia bacterium]|nr:epimerase [Spirochaetia bacterium]